VYRIKTRITTLLESIPRNDKQQRKRKSKKHKRTPHLASSPSRGEANKEKIRQGYLNKFRMAKLGV